jgi:hypothetical protein
LLLETIRSLAKWGADGVRLRYSKINAEDEETLTLVTPQNMTIRINRENIDEQSASISAMPEMTKALTLREIRDLVEYLSTRGNNNQP